MISWSYICSRICLILFHCSICAFYMIFHLFPLTAFVICRDRRDGMSKEGSGRVAIMRATGLLRSYTLECNYNTGRTHNPTPPSPLDHKKTPQAPLTSPPKYTPAVFEDVSVTNICSRIDQASQSVLCFEWAARLFARVCFYGRYIWLKKLPETQQVSGKGKACSR